MAEKNSTIINSIWLNGSNDYQQRIPQATQEQIAATEQALFEPMNAQYLNQFMDALITRIGYTYVRGSSFDNPLREFKSQDMRYGGTIQEIALPWIKAHAYVDNVETLLKVYRPDADVVYHTQNRQDKYPITINREELRTAFTSEYGLNDLVSKILDTPRNSDEYDEYQIMKQLMAFYGENLGYYKVNLSTFPNSESSGRDFLKKVKTIAGKIKFPTTLYNAQKITNIPVFANPSELILFVTPEVEATLDVDTLALMFHIEKAEIPFRIITIDEFPMAGAVALLTTRDFFVCHDTEYSITNFYNPETLSYNYYLHHWGIYSVSPFVPAILFTTDSGTSPITVSIVPDTLTVTPDTSNVVAGQKLQLNFDLSGVTTPSGIVDVKPDSVLSVVTVNGEKQNPLTAYVDRLGVFHVPSDAKTGTIYNIDFTSTYYNPSKLTQTEFTATGTYTVVDA